MYRHLTQAWQQNLRALRQPGSFAQNLAVTFSGSAAVALLGLLLTPVMTRLYPPESYGLFAIYSSLISNVSLVATLAYPGAFLLPRTREGFLALVQLTVVLALAVLVVSGAAALLWGGLLMDWLQVRKLGAWFYAIPLLAFVLAMNGVMSSWYLRTKDFKKRASIDVATSLTGRGLTIGYGLWLGGSLPGLLLGDVFSRVVAFLGLLRSGIHRSLGELARTFSWRVVRAAAVEYREYPFFQMPAGYLGVLSSQLPVFMLTGGFGVAAAGLYSFAAGILEMPVTLLGNAISPVFLQKATETHAERPEQVKEMVLSLYYKLLYLGLVPFGILTVFGDVLFRVAFGARWETAGLYAGYLGYYYVFRLTSNATSAVFTVYRRQNLLLVVIGTFALSRAAALGVGLLLHNANLALLLFGVVSTVVAFMFDMVILRLLGTPIGPVVSRTAALVGLTLAVLYALRWGGEPYWPVLRALPPTAPASP